MKLVLIEWEDSARPVPSWRHLDDLPEPAIITCLSVGWLVHDDEQVKMLAPNVGDIDSEENNQASGIIRIPARSVKCITNLTECE